MQRTVRIIGPGRAGRSLAIALARAGWATGLVGRPDVTPGLSHGVDAVVLATPDDAVGDVAALLDPDPDTVVVHLSGSLGLDVLHPHPRRGALHPLVPLPDAETGAERLASGITFAVAGDPLATEMAECLSGRAVVVADAERAAYHAAACIASNHVVALLGQVERVAAAAGLELSAFLGLTQAALDDVARLGPRRALTGPAVRGDWATLERHLAALADEERSPYSAGVGLALQLAADGPAAVVPGTGALVVVDDDEIDDVPEVRVPGGVGATSVGAGVTVG